MYSCPVCKIESREKDTTNKKGKLVVRELWYGCGTVMRVTQDGMSFKSYIDKGEKCCQDTYIGPRTRVAG
mgnify:CR=1 FL=1